MTSMYFKPDSVYKLTNEQRQWFGDRMDESHTGRVIVPSHLYKKFRKIVDNEFLSNEQIKDYLIEYCYQSQY